MNRINLFFSTAIILINLIALSSLTIAQRLPTQTKAVCSSDGILLAVLHEMGSESYVRIYHVKTLQLLALLKIPKRVFFDEIFFNADLQKIGLRGRTSSLIIDIKSQKLDVVNADFFNFSINEEQFLASSNNVFAIYNLETREKVAVFEGIPKDEVVEDVIESPNLKLVAARTQKRRYYLWKRTAGHHKNALKVFEHGIDAKFSSDGQFFHFLTYKKDRCYVNTYETENFRIKSSFNSKNRTNYSNYDFVEGSSFSPEGTYVLFKLGEDYFEVFKVDTQQLINVFIPRSAYRYQSYNEMPRTWLNDSTLTFFEQKVEADEKYGHLYSIASNKLEELNLKTYFEVCMKSPDMKWIVSWKLDEEKIKQIALQSSMKKEVYFAENITPLLYSPDSRLLFVEKIINNKNYYGFIFTSDFFNNQRKVYKFADVPLSRDGEPVSGEDPLPPDNYKYFFSKSLKVYDPTLRGEIYAFVFKNLVIDDNKKANLSFSWHDTLGNQYTKMTTLNFRQHICEVNLIRENKQKIPVSDWKITEHYDDGPSLIVLVLDHSGSMGDERALAMQEGVKKLIENKRPKDSIALIRYDSKVKVFSKPSVDKDYLLERNPLNGLEGFGRSTALLDGTHRAVRGLSKESSNQKRAILLITDGFENSSFVTENDVIREAIKYNVPIYAIGFGYYVDVDLLTQLAESTQGTYYQIYSTDFLLDIFEDVYKKMSYYYTLSFDVPSMQENYILQVKFCKKNLGIFEVPLNPKKKPVEEDEFFLGETFEEDEVISLKEGQSLEIHFGFNVDQIFPEDIKKIENVAAFLKKNPKIRIALHGHTDNVGSDAYNNALSLRRANEVKRRLVRLGVEAARIETKGLGASLPVASNQTEEGRAKNRRVEMKILKK